MLGSHIKTPFNVVFEGYARSTSPLGKFGSTIKGRFLIRFCHSPMSAMENLSAAIRTVLSAVKRRAEAPSGQEVGTCNIYQSDWLITPPCMT
jgi:hypothetical protein